MISFHTLSGGFSARKVLYNQYIYTFSSQAFRYLSHKFHGKIPGKLKSEKRQKKHADDLVSGNTELLHSSLKYVDKIMDSSSHDYYRKSVVEILFL